MSSTFPFPSAASDEHTAPDYIAWLTANLPGRRNLASAGAGVDGAAVLAGAGGADTEDGLDIYALASRRYHCPLDCLVPALGATHAMALAVGALLKRGEAMAIETPGYAPFTQIVQACGGRSLPVPRPRVGGFRIDMQALREALSAGARAFILTNAHNPSGAVLHPEDILAAASLCASFGAWVLVCEIYDPAAFSGRPVWFSRSAFRAAPNIICITSLAKLAGLGRERIGWVAAPSEAAQHIRAFRGVTMGDVMPASLEPVARRCAAAMEALEQTFTQSMRARENLVTEWLADVGRFVPATRFAWSAFVLLHFGSPEAVQTLCDRLLRAYNLLIVPGRFFGAPCDARIGLGGPLHSLAPALEMLGAELRSSRAVWGG
ncbi:Aspartate/methionine/tyrosine aminotransferase [Roseateles sp. YR242]|uniref:pyridoxal phosphate-dependent aminotransferase n=1 Tax=Roseateles sp. YR242 TaxID=1855305 RepID=UPI0008D845E7|nr:pyridoxal phosphate-dependent aminotransferase [Roseateles sp. YR242]SEL52497.1 Aspartate/methionine/tyrosine aminotransferase [Roseateles sp. YR242]